MRNRDMFLPQMPSEEMALPGRASEMQITDNHYILGSSQIAPNGNNLVFWCRLVFRTPPSQLLRF